MFLPILDELSHCSGVSILAQDRCGRQYGWAALGGRWWRRQGWHHCEERHQAGLAARGTTSSHRCADIGVALMEAYFLRTFCKASFHGACLQSSAHWKLCVSGDRIDGHTPNSRFSKLARAHHSPSLIDSALEQGRGRRCAAMMRSREACVSLVFTRGNEPDCDLMGRACQRKTSSGYGSARCVQQAP